MASAVADRFDIEIVRRQVGPGVPGFVARLPRAPAGTGPFVITARSSQGQSLGTAITVRSLDALKSCIATPRISTLEGMVDLMAAGQLEGWVWDRANPDRVVGLDILDGETLLGRTVADKMRGDLRQAGKRSGACGFSFALPATLLDMKPHSIRVVATGTSIELPNSPMDFGPIVLSPLVEEVARLRQEVDLLTKRMAGLDTPDGAFQRGIMTTMVERVSAYAAIHHELIERRLDGMTDPPSSSMPETIAPLPAPKTRKARGKSAE